MGRILISAASALTAFAATATAWGQTDTDAPSLANPELSAAIVLRCGGLYDQYEVRTNSAHYRASFAQCAFDRCVSKRRGSRTTVDLFDHYMEFPIDADRSWKMRIEWREQAYSVYFITQEHSGRPEIVDAGFCRERRP